MRAQHFVAAFFTVFLAPIRAQAGEVSIVASWKGAPLAPPKEARLRFLDATHAGAVTPTLEEPISLGVTKKLVVRPGQWWVMVVGDDVWGEARQIRVSEDEQAVALDVWPGGEIIGTLSPPTGSTLPAEIKTRVTPAPGVSGPKETLSRCRVEDTGKFRCRVPALKLDVRLRADSYVSHHRWALEVPRGGVVQLGTLKLEAGASVVGWVATEDGSPITPEARARLEPAAVATPLAGDKTPRSELLAWQTEVYERGFFQFDGMPPGRYLLTVTQPPFGEATAEVEVFANVEAELSTPLVLAKPAALLAEIHPPLDPWGDPWRAVLYRSDRRRGRGERVRAEAVPADGYLKLEGLSRGTYLLHIVSSDDSPWAVRRVAVGEEPMPLAITLEPVAVSGRVTLADKPVAAKLWFGGQRAGIHVQTQSDEEGTYSAVLPRPGEWLLEVEATSPPIKTFLEPRKIEPKAGEAAMRLDVELPDTRIKLKVVDESSRPIARALVTLEGAVLDKTPSPLQDWTDSQGQLEMAGLPPGTYFARASAGPELSAASVPVAVADGYEVPEVTLTVRRQKKVVAKVRSVGGPIAGARLVAVPAGAERASVGIPQTDVSGEVELVLAPEVALLDIVAEAPGHALRMARVAVPPDGPLTIDLEREGGTLRLKVPVPDDKLGPHATLTHGGYTAHVGLFRLINRGQEVSGVLKNVLTLSEMEPGAYSLCPIAAAGPPPVVGPSCVSGLLQPGGFLELALRE